MIYDCFSFFNELDLLEIRLCLLYDHVDKFVIVEANKTHSNKPKPLFFEENKTRFEKYSDKIIYIKALDLPDSNDAWVLEKAQRETIKKGLLNCSDDDIIIISDLDELVDPAVLKKSITEPTRINMYLYYYFLNWKTNEIWNQSFISPYKFIKNESLSYLRTNIEVIPNSIPVSESGNSKHLSYLYGFDLKKYTTKLNSFAHQEYNKSPFTSSNHLKFCLKYQMDILLRKNIRITIDKSYSHLIKLNLKDNELIKKCIYKQSLLNKIPNLNDLRTFLEIYLFENSISYSDVTFLLKTKIAVNFLFLYLNIFIRNTKQI